MFEKTRQISHQNGKGYIKKLSCEYVLLMLLYTQENGAEAVKFGLYAKQKILTRDYKECCFDFLGLSITAAFFKSKGDFMQKNVLSSGSSS